METNRPLIIAHRGASADAPENTLAAFRLAIEQGADGIELDLHMSADGQLVVIHDETLNRTTNGSGLVIRHTYRQLRNLDASIGFEAYAGEPVPLLSEVLELIRPTRLMLNIELKNGIIRYPDMEEAVVRMVRDFRMESRVVFSSFNHYSVVKLRELAPEIECAVLTVAGLYQPWKYVQSLGVQGIHPYFYSVVPEVVEGIRQAGLKIRPYTVDEEEDLRRMIELKVDAVITDVPARMKTLLDQPRRSEEDYLRDS